MVDRQLRFAATARVYGQQALESFSQAHVLVVGIGGVGSWAAEALARNGLGHIYLLDHDTISESNINRQLHSLETNIGQSKIRQMKQRIKAINADCEVVLIEKRLEPDNCQQILQSYPLDYVIDAIDNVSSKAALLAQCKRQKIKVVTTGGAGGMSDPTQIKQADLSKTYNDALAAKVRYQLRSRYGFPGQGKKKFAIPCVFSSQQPVYPQADGSVGKSKPQTKGLRLDCNYGYGSSVCITASFGMHAAAIVLNKLAS